LVSCSELLGFGFGCFLDRLLVVRHIFGCIGHLCVLNLSVFHFLFGQGFGLRYNTQASRQLAVEDIIEFALTYSVELEGLNSGAEALKGVGVVD
jgi:hypothetical protein